jgi:hypothetical protein
MGLTSSKNDILSIKNKVKKDEILQTILHTKHFKFAFLMHANMSEIERVQERWSDFLLKSKDEFMYITTTRRPQTIKIFRDNEELFLSLSTKISINEDDLSSFTKMFNSMETTIKEIHEKDVVGLSFSSSNNSSLNLLVKN